MRTTEKRRLLDRIRELENACRLNGIVVPNGMECMRSILSNPPYRGKNEK